MFFSGVQKVICGIYKKKEKKFQYIDSVWLYKVFNLNHSKFKLNFSGPIWTYPASIDSLWLRVYLVTTNGISLLHALQWYLHPLCCLCCASIVMGVQLYNIYGSSMVILWFNYGLFMNKWLDYGSILVWSWFNSGQIMVGHLWFLIVNLSWFNYRSIMVQLYGSTTIDPWFIHNWNEIEL